MCKAAPGLEVLRYKALGLAWRDAGTLASMGARARPGRRVGTARPAPERIIPELKTSNLEP